MPENSSSGASVTAFVSYAREDAEFVKKLSGALTALNTDLQGDWLLERGENYREQLRLLILACDVFLFILSPESVTSTACAAETDIAAQHGKRIIPISYRDHVEDNLVHPALRDVQWTFIRGDAELHDGVMALTEAVRTDYELAREHRRLLLAADNWERNGRARGYLLRREALQAAETWLAASGANPRGLPKPTALQSEFIIRSQRNRRNETRGMVTVVSSVAVTLGILAIYAIVERDTAVSNEQAAVSNQHQADEQRKKAQSNAAEAERQRGLAVEKQKEAEAQTRIATSRWQAAESEGLLENRLDLAYLLAV